MKDSSPTFHFTCTPDHARKLIKEHDSFWVSNCGCREDAKGCRRSRIDVCLYFREMEETSGTGMHEVSRREAIKVLRLAKASNLVARPFRNEEDKAVIDGICFCCDDCCCYFLEPEKHRSDKGLMIERTDVASCVMCGGCETVCYFGARVADGKVEVIPERCHGCGLCVDICPYGCISMVPRS